MKRIFLYLLCLLPIANLQAQSLGVSNATNCDLWVTFKFYDPNTGLVVDYTNTMVVRAGGSVRTTIASYTWTTGVVSSYIAAHGATCTPPTEPAGEWFGIAVTDNPACATGGVDVPPGGALGPNGGSGPSWITSNGGCNNASCSGNTATFVNQTFSNFLPPPPPPPPPLIPCSNPDYAAWLDNDYYIHQ